MSHAILDLFAGPGGWDVGLRMLGRGSDVLGIERGRWTRNDQMRIASVLHVIRR